MELAIEAFREKALGEGKSSEEALKIGIEKAIESAVHLHKERSASHLSESIALALHTKLEALGVEDEELLRFAFETLLRSVQSPKEKEIERLIVEIDRLKRHLASEEEELQRQMRELFVGIENATNKLEEAKRQRWLEALENTALEHVEGLGILTETVEAALVAALEEGEEVKEAIREVSRHITHKALGEGLLSAARIRAIITTILTKASELAEATPTHAKEILQGAVQGINDALIATVTQLKEQLEFTPEEIKTGHILNWNEMIKMLSRSDELYQEIIEHVATKSPPFIADLLRQSATKANHQFIELKDISSETIAIAKTKLTTLAKEAAARGIEIRSQLASEAKKLGTRAWRKAIEVAKAYKIRKG